MDPAASAPPRPSTGPTSGHGPGREAGPGRAPGSGPASARRALRALALLAALAPASAVPVGLTLAAAPGAARAQDFGRVVSPILTLDRDQLFASTLYGQRINRELEAASTAMAAETRAIEAALEAEEQELTAKRATTEPDAFRELASAFDAKVQSLRADRDAAEADLRDQIEAAQLAFFNRIGPILGQVVRDRGAVLIIDRRAVLLTAANVDITDEAIGRIDAVLGDGGDLGTDAGTGANVPPDALGDTAPDAPADIPGRSDGTRPGTMPELDTIPAPTPPDDTAQPGAEN